jgi:hypothetical protein
MAAWVKCLALGAIVVLVSCGQTKSSEPTFEPPPEAAVAGRGGIGPVFPEGCEGAGGPVGNPSWPARLTVSEGAVYCSRLPSAASLEEELASKAKLTIVPGVYEMPLADEAATFKVPICIAEQDRVVVSDVGSIAHTVTGDTHRFEISQPLSGESSTWVSNLRVTAPAGAHVSATLTGAAFLPSDATSFFQQRCSSVAACGGDSLVFLPCSSANYSEYAHRVEFEDGWVEFRVQRGPGAPATASSALVLATGSYRGTSFEQADFFGLVLRDANAPQFAVVFAKAISDAGGIEVDGFSVAPPEVGTDPTRVYLTDSELTRLKEVEVSNLETRVITDGS